MSVESVRGKFAAAILTGGRNSRMRGVNKAFLEIEGAPIIKKSLTTLKETFEEVFLVTNTPADYSSYSKDAIVITDKIKYAGPLGGIHAALSKTAFEAVFFVACDMPFLHNDLIRRQIAYFEGSGADAAVPRIAGSIEPLHAVYKKKLKDNIADFIKISKDYSVRAFLETVGVSYWDLEDNFIHRHMFKNLNTEEDLKRARGADI